MENNNIKNSIIEDAVVELNAIVEAANKSARDRMVKELPEQFEKLLKEEIKRNKESVNESVKDVIKEPIKEGKKRTDNNKESLNEMMEEIDLSELSINDIEEAYNEASIHDEFEVSPENDEELDLEDLENELGGMNVEMDEMRSPPTVRSVGSHGISGYVSNSKNKNRNTNPNSTNNTNPNMQKESENSNDPFDQIKKLHEILSEMIDSNEQGGNTNYSENISESDKVNDEEVIDEDESFEDHDGIEETAGSQKGQAINRTAGNENMPTSSPRKNSTQREFQQESVKKTWSNKSVKKFITQKNNLEKRMSSLISENKKTTKKLNELKNENKKIERLSEENNKFKNILVKYRNQLSEMAIFNTNLAGVNSILVNENLALTTDDKKEIINKFKNVKSITESENTYKNILSEMQTAKKTITESVENKVNTNINKSSSEKVVEQTAYVNEHVNKIKSLMNYVDNHGNSRVL